MSSEASQPLIRLLLLLGMHLPFPFVWLLPSFLPLGLVSPEASLPLILLRQGLPAGYPWATVALLVEPLFCPVTYLLLLGFPVSSASGMSFAFTQHSGVPASPPSLTAEGWVLLLSNLLLVLFEIVSRYIVRAGLGLIAVLLPQPRHAGDNTAFLLFEAVFQLEGGK